jgi:hypothetical protein
MRSVATILVVEDRPIDSETLVGTVEQLVGPSHPVPAPLAATIAGKP